MFYCEALLLKDLQLSRNQLWSFPASAHQLDKIWLGANKKTKKQRDDTKKENKDKEQIQKYFPVSPLSKWFRTLRTHSTIAIEIEIDISWTLLFLHPFSKIHINSIHMSLWRSSERHLYEIWDWYWIFSEKWSLDPIRSLITNTNRTPRASTRLRISEFTQNFWFFSVYIADFWQSYLGK